MKPKGQDINAYYRELEREVGLTVISCAPSWDRGACNECGDREMIFHCQTYPDRAIWDLCKECAIKRAGGEEKVYVRTGEYLRRKWFHNARLPCRLPRSHGGVGRSGAEEGQW